MATRRWSIGPNERVQDIVEAVGAATATKSIELTVDLAAIKGGAIAQIQRSDVLLALEEMADYIQKGQWPPA